MMSRHFKLLDFIECGETYHQGKIDNSPHEPNSVTAIEALSYEILDPLKEKYGDIQLTYALSTRNLLTHIERRIAPRYDQHAAHELNGRGTRICRRDGFAVDFQIAGVGSLSIAKQIARELPFDRLYFYGDQRPLHVSYGPEHSRNICVMSYNENRDRWFPQTYSIDRFLTLDE
jgi:hypothetical protein